MNFKKVFGALQRDGIASTTAGEAGKQQQP
jgi:hypothetical protein